MATNTRPNYLTYSIIVLQNGMWREVSQHKDWFEARFYCHEITSNNVGKSYRVASEAELRRMREKGLAL